MWRLALPHPPLNRRFFNLVHKIIKVECAIVDHQLHLGHLHLCILPEELLDAHEAAADAHHQPPRDQLHVDFPRPEHVVPIAQSLDRHRLPQRVEVLRDQLVNQVALDRPVPLQTRLRTLGEGVFLGRRFLTTVGGG